MCRIELHVKRFSTAGPLIQEISRYWQRENIPGHRISLLEESPELDSGARENVNTCRAPSTERSVDARLIEIKSFIAASFQLCRIVLIAFSQVRDHINS